MDENMLDEPVIQDLNQTHDAGTLLSRLLDAAQPIAAVVAGATIVRVAFFPLKVTVIGEDETIYPIQSDDFGPLGDAVAAVLTAGLAQLPAAARERIMELLRLGVADIQITIHVWPGVVEAETVVANGKVLLFRLMARETAH